jgi:hypothetical protein
MWLIEWVIYLVPFAGCAAGLAAAYGHLDEGKAASTPDLADAKKRRARREGAFAVFTFLVGIIAIVCNRSAEQKRRDEDLEFRKRDLEFKNSLVEKTLADVERGPRIAGGRSFPPTGSPVPGHGGQGPSGADAQDALAQAGRTQEPVAPKDTSSSVTSNGRQPVVVLPHIDFDADALLSEQTAGRETQGSQETNQAIARELAPTYRTRCDQGDVRACHALARFLALTSPLDAVPLYQRACNAGFAWSCQNLGTLFFDTKKLGGDFEQAKEYYSKGCELSSVPGPWATANKEASRMSCHDLAVAKRRALEMQH